MKYITKRVGKAVYDWDMIKDGDQIAVGLSGGKDSSLLLFLLSHFQRIAPVNFELLALHIDLGWGADINPLAEYCQSLGVKLVVEKTKIGPIVFEHRREKNPCALCANMRRGALCTTARRLKIEKIALGHHLDDVLETLLLNMFYNGTFKCFLPNTYLDRTGVTVIRPLVYLPEKIIARTASSLNVPILPSPCPNCGKSKRQEIKNLISSLEKQIPQIRQNLLASLRNVNLTETWTRSHFPVRIYK